MGEGEKEAWRAKVERREAERNALLPPPATGPCYGHACFL